jgi:hypothetical protein
LQFDCVLPDKFVVGGIIAKLVSNWRDFATSLKHKKKAITVEGLIATFDVGERARSKDVSHSAPQEGGCETWVPMGPHRPGSWRSLTSGSDLSEAPPTCKWTRRPYPQPGDLNQIPETHRACGARLSPRSRHGTASRSAECGIHPVITEDDLPNL